MKRTGTTMQRAVLMLVMLLAAIPGPTRAQDRSLRTSTRIRIQSATMDAESPASDTGWLVGTLDRLDADSLWLLLDPGGRSLIAIDRSAVRRLQVSNGRRRNPRRGALWGAGAGFALGLLAVATLDECTMGTRGWTWDICSDNQDFLILGNTVAGAAWGAAIGLLITSERWVPVAHGNLIPRGAGGGPGLTLGFRLPH